jgi:hypothetical protein
MAYNPGFVNFGNACLILGGVVYVAHTKRTGKQDIQS